MSCNLQLEGPLTAITQPNLSPNPNLRVDDLGDELLAELALVGGGDDQRRHEGAVGDDGLGDGQG